MKKKIIFSLVAVFAALFVGSFVCSCSQNDMAQMKYDREAKSAKYMSEYATTVNSLEMSEGNFRAYRRIVFYNVRLGENVFVCEGFAHVQIDKDGDIEIVVKTGENEYLRHYLGQKQDITYFSEQLKPTGKGFHYTITWNPKLWVPEILQKTVYE
jgi:hypothetical protein